MGALDARWDVTRNIDSCIFPPKETHFRLPKVFWSNLKNWRICPCGDARWEGALTYIYIHIYINIHIYIWTYIHLYVYVNTCIFGRGLLDAQRDGALYIDIHVYVYTYMHIYMYTHTCIIQKGWRLCCSVLQCVALCCSVLQCVAVCCSVLQWALTLLTCILRKRWKLWSGITVTNSHNSHELI